MSAHVSRDADGGHSVSSPRVEDRRGAAASEGRAERVPSPQTQHRTQVTQCVCVFVFASVLIGRLSPSLRCVSPLLLDDTYVNRKSHVIKAERRVLKELGFCVHVKHPHKVKLMMAHTKVNTTDRKSLF